MLQINPFLDCTLYSRIVVHIGQNNQSIEQGIKNVQIPKNLKTGVYIIALLSGNLICTLYSRIVVHIGQNNHNLPLHRYQASLQCESEFA
jgi:hypothetical protein